MFAVAFLAFSSTIGTRWPFLAFALPGGFLVGFHAGRIASYGRLGARLKAHGALPAVVVAHVDGAAGLRPVGDFFFFQAMVVAIPAAFLAVWWFVIPIGWQERYGYWRNSFLVLLVVAVLVEVLAFLGPMMVIHHHMVASKRKLQLDADRLAHRIAQLQTKAADGETEDQTRVLDRLQSRFNSIETLPTWPVDARTRRRFSLNNIGLLLPVIGHALGQSRFWEDVEEFLRNFQS